MQQKQPIEMVKMMTHYGIVLGGLIGFAGAVPIALLWFDISILLPVLALSIIITMCGGLVGMMYGVVSGFISGILMNFATRFFFRRVNEKLVYKSAMGLLTLATVVLIFCIDMLFIGGQKADFFTRTIQPTDWYAIWLMSLVFAVYASQRTAGEYLHYSLDTSSG